MLRRVVVLIAVLASMVLVSCRKEGKGPIAPRREGTAVIPEDASERKENDRINLRPKTPFFMERSALSETLNAQGAVESDNTTVHAGSPVHLTLYLKESPPGLQTGAVWYQGERALRHDVKPAAGAKVLTFTLDDSKLAPGKYRVIGYWGGNVAADKQFEIVAAASKKKR